MPLMASRRVWINVGLFVVFTIVFLSQTSVQDYLLSRSPHERLMRHFAEFERKAGRDPDIHRALEGVSDMERSGKLQEMSRNGTARLDNAALLERAPTMSAIYSRLSDRACANAVKGYTPSENDKAEFEGALLRLEADFVTKWMGSLQKAMRAEALATPMHLVTQEEMRAAFGALEGKIGKAAAMRVDAGLTQRATDAEFAWAARTIYAVAPSLPEPHGSALLRMMTQLGEETPASEPIPPLIPEVR